MANGETGELGSPGDDPLEAVSELVANVGVAGRRLRVVVGLLAERPHALASLVRASGADRRTVESVLLALGDDLESEDDQLRIRGSRVAAYRDRFGYEQLHRTELVDPLGARLDEAADLVREMDALIAAAPGARQALDHVSATGETVVRRALWLDSTFDLAGKHVLCAGDHDLTSLAIVRVNPATMVTVADVDERILEFIDGQAVRAGSTVRCLFADFRFGMARGALEWADLVMTDPPYSPEGVRLFLSRGIEGLRDRENARVVMAYGFGERHPGLGLKVQQAVSGLNLVYEAMLPDFNRYFGAQAVGSSSDLYVLRPTARSWRGRSQAAQEAANIYTRGPQALEAVTAPDEHVSESVLAAAAGPRGLSVVARVGGGWADGESAPAAVSMAQVLQGGVPSQLTGGRPAAVAVNLAAGADGLLARVLLATDIERLAVLVPNNHPDLSDEQSQRQLIELLGCKYRLRLRRSTPDSRYAIVEADRVNVSDLDAGEQVARWLLDRPHGRVGNTWREGLIRCSRSAGGATLTKNEARRLLRDCANRHATLDELLIDLPRHQVRALLAEVAYSASRLT